MRRYGKIATSLWVSSGKWKDVQRDDAKLLYFYLQTCTHSSPVGTYVLPMAYAEADLKWSREEILQCMEVLQDAELVEYDEAESVVHLYGALKVDPPHNQNHAKGMVTTIKALPDCRCKQLCIDEFKSLTVCEPFRDRFDTVSIPLSNPIETTGKERKGTGTGVVVPREDTSDDSPPPSPPATAAGGESTRTDEEATDGPPPTTATISVSEMAAIAKDEVAAWNRDFPETTKALTDECYDQQALLELQRQEGKTAEDFARWRKHLKDEGSVPRFFARPREYLRVNASGQRKWGRIEAEIEAKKVRGGRGGSPGPEADSTHVPALRTYR